MCVVCGCGDSTHPPHHSHAHADGHEHGHGHGHGHGHSNGHAPAPVQALDFGANAARVSVPGLDAARTLRIETDILAANDSVAQRNRAHFQAHGVTALNLLSSPGSGKTTLLCATIAALRARDPAQRIAVIEGDQQTSFDAERIRATGAPAVQVNTGKGCHLDAPMVAEAFAQLHDHHHGHHHHGHEQEHYHHHGAELLFIENVGNLVCPALWDLGEAAKIVVLSVTEGEDKPLKYPDMFAAAELMLLNKTDLLPHLRFDVERCIAMARRVNPSIAVLQLSATTGEGMDAWLHWLDHRSGHAHAHGPDADPAVALRERVQQLEAELARARADLAGAA